MNPLRWFGKQACCHLHHAPITGAKVKECEKIQVRDFVIVNEECVVKSKRDLDSSKSQLLPNQRFSLSHEFASKESSDTNNYNE